MAKKRKDDVQTSGTKDLTLKSALKRLGGRRRRVDDAVNAAQGRKRHGQSTDSSQ